MKDGSRKTGLRKMSRVKRCSNAKMFERKMDESMKDVQDVQAKQFLQDVQKDGSRMATKMFSIDVL